MPKRVQVRYEVSEADSIARGLLPCAGCGHALHPYDRQAYCALCSSCRGAKGFGPLEVEGKMLTSREVAVLRGYKLLVDEDEGYITRPQPYEAEVEGKLEAELQEQQRQRQKWPGNTVVVRYS